MNILCLQAPRELDRRHSGAWLDVSIGSIEPQHDLVEIDLSATETIDARGVAALLTLNRCFSAPGVRVRLVNPSVAVVQLLELMGMHRVFQFASRSQDSEARKETIWLRLSDAQALTRRERRRVPGFKSWAFGLLRARPIQ